MSSQDGIRRLAVAVAMMAAFFVFGASGAQAATPASVDLGTLATQEDDEPSDEDPPSDEEQEDSEDSEDSDDEDSDDEDSDSEDETDEPTDEPTFTDPPTTEMPTEDTTGMPTEDAGATSEAGPSPLGWVLLAGGVASAVAAVLVYRRNRHIM